MRPYSQDRYVMRGDVVRPRSRADIRSTADKARRLIGLNPGDKSTWTMLDKLSVLYGLTYDVVEDHEMPSHHAEACCVPEHGVIYIPTKGARAIDRGDLRMRFTVHHEIGHFILGHTKSFARSSVEPRPYIDSEWQADCFAAEIVMPLEVIQREKLWSISAIQRRFGVSESAATTRMNTLRKENLVPNNY